MDKAIEWVVVGRFGRPHGIKGLVTIISFTEPRDNLMQYKHWHARVDNQWQPIDLLHLEMNNKHILASVKGYQEREDVARLTNIDIAIDRTQLPALNPGEYYWHELEGMQVVTKQGDLLGTVIEIMATGANDVLVVVGEKRYLIPYLLDKVIININDSRREITVDWDVDF